MRKTLLIISTSLFISILIISCKQEKSIKDKIVDFAVSDLKAKLDVPSSFVLDSTRIGDKPVGDVFRRKNEPNIQRWEVEIFCQAQNGFGVLMRHYVRYYSR